MGLFTKDVNKDLQQTQEVKEAATAPPSINSMNQTQVSAPPSFDTPNQNMNNGSEKPFVNPFAQQQQQQQVPEVNQTPQAPPLDINVQNTTPEPAVQQNTSPNPFSEQQTQKIEQNHNSNLDEDAIKELIVENVEKIIDERWEKITKNVENVVQWKDKIEREVDLLKHDIGTIKEGFEQFEKRLLNKVNSYDRNILDVNSEIKALEKVFNKITPTLVNNVNELSKIADNLRGVKNDAPNEE